MRAAIGADRGIGIDAKRRLIRSTESVADQSAPDIAARADRLHTDRGHDPLRVTCRAMTWPRSASAGHTGFTVKATDMAIATKNSPVRKRRRDDPR